MTTEPGAVAALVRGWPVGSAAVAVTDGQRTWAVGDADRPYRWASVTKIVTALAVLEAVADGEVSLNDPVGPPGATLRHLLAHASGLPFGGDAPVAAVGVRRTYSNTGYELAAAHVAAATGRPFADDVRDRVLAPLGMVATTLDGSPAHGAAGPLADLARIAGELLDPRVLQPEIVTQASTVVYPGLEGVLPGYGRQSPNDWALGCEVRGTKAPHWTAPANSPRTFGHFGQSGSFLWVDPDAGVACACLAGTPFGPWAVEAWPQLSATVLAGRWT
ncbi:MAG: serine hydrolase domain-containing protein [Kineosporiaceae bacterium]